MEEFLCGHDIHSRNQMENGTYQYWLFNEIWISKHRLVDVLYYKAIFDFFYFF